MVYPKGFDNAVDSLLNESDRGCVLVAAAHLEELLEDVLRAYFVDRDDCARQAINPLFAGMGPLSTFSAKIKIVYALGLVDATLFRDMEGIRKIRNEFAHSVEKMLFRSQSVADRVNNLSCSDLGGREGRYLEEKEVSIEVGDGTIIGKDGQRFMMKARAQFTVATGFVMGRLTGVLDAIKERKAQR